MNIAVGSLIILAAIVCFVWLYRGSWLLNPAALFSLSWLGGLGVSQWKLSKLQTDWEPMTWAVVLGAFAAFMAGYFAARSFRTPKAVRTAAETGSVEARQGSGTEEAGREKAETKGLLACIFLLTLVALCAFITEAVLLQYIPLFTTDTPHAYSYFHISGLHYFTVSCVLIPGMAVLYYHQRPVRKPDRNSVIAALCTTVSLMLPILLVSRFQLIFAVMLAGLTWLCTVSCSLSILHNRRLLISLLAAFLLLLILYVFLTVERAHSISYLNGIFEMRNPETPIWITQPYIYIANNYDNLNCLVRDLPAHTHGLRMLFPLFALTGLKFLKPEWVSFPIYVTKEELTTVTLVYDAYYDFGLPGVLVFMLILGAAAALLERAVRKKTGMPVLLKLFYAQFVFYLLFSFFTTWYSNPATWFYYGLTILAQIFIHKMWCPK